MLFLRELIYAYLMCNAESHNNFQRTGQIFWGMIMLKLPIILEMLQWDYTVFLKFIVYFSVNIYLLYFYIWVYHFGL